VRERQLPPPREAWWQWFGQAFHAWLYDKRGRHGVCVGCGAERDDIDPNGGKCPGCWALATKKPKAGEKFIPGKLAGRVGPDTSQALLITATGAQYIGNLASPPGLPTGAEILTGRSRQRWLAELLLDPPEPPFYLALLARSCDSVLASMRATLGLRRVHIAGNPAATVDAVAIREVIEALGDGAGKALYQLRMLRPALARGAGSGSESLAAFKAYRKLAEELPCVSELFPATGRWIMEPGFDTYAWAGACANSLERKKGAAS